MQKNIFKIIFMLFLLWGTNDLQAQTGKDTVDGTDVYYYHLENDSIKKKMHIKKLKMDSSHAKQLKQIRAGVSHHKSRDSFHFSNKIKMDTLHKRMFLRKMKSDSFRFKHEDSLHFAIKRVKLDSLRFKTHLKLKLDSFHVRLDSFHKFKRVKMDSLHIKLKIKKMEGELKRLKKNLQDRKYDSAYVKSEPVKQISLQLACNADVMVDIKNLSRHITVRSTTADVVRLVANIALDEGRDLTDESSFKKLGIQLTGSGKDILINRPETGTASPKRITTGSNSNNWLTVYVPEKASMNIENSFADIAIENDMKELAVTIVNGNLVMLNAGNAVIKSSNGFVKAGLIKEGDIQLSGCQFICESIDQLKINSRYSNVRFARSSALSFKSVSDRYEIQQVTDVQGDKTFGELRISNLKNSFVLNGSSADVKIANIELKAALIRIDNKYADIQLPVTKLQNYSVDFDGARSNVSAPFEKHFVRTNAIATQGNSNMKTVANFTAAVGNVNNGHTKFQINCSSCIIDFN